MASNSKTQEKALAPTYTVDEFAKAPESLNVTSGDLIRAAFRKAGKDEATLDEAKKLVSDFKKKEVK